MSFNIDDFGKFKIIQDDGNWVDKNRFIAVVNYWANYFNTMTVKAVSYTHLTLPTTPYV